MTPIQAAQEILKLEKEATPGPWKCTLDGQEYSIEGDANAIESPGNNIVSTDKSQSETAGIICYCIYPRTDGDFIAFSRNHAPLIAKALIKAMAALDFITGDCVTENGMRMAAREALKEIESL